MERRKAKSEDSEIRKLAQDIGASLLSDAPKVAGELLYTSSGSTELDCCLGGGFRYGTVINIIGDSSTGKTLLACEIVAYAQRLQNAVVVFLDREGTLQSDQAKKIGVLIDRVILDDESVTVEDLYNSVEAILSKYKNNRPLIFVCDSLDALTSEAESESNIKDKGYGGLAKAKKMSEIFRRIVGKVHKRRVLLVIISQTRAKIGVMFGTKWSVAGGDALKFYSTHRVLLSQASKLNSSKDVKKPKIYGINIKAKVIKNKEAPPFKEARFDILFDRGIDDLGSCITYLKTAYYGTSYELYKKKFNSKEKFIKYIEDNNFEDEIKKLTIAVWKESNRNDTKRKPKW